MAPTEQKVYFLLVEILDEVKAIHKLIEKSITPVTPITMGSPPAPQGPPGSIVYVDEKPKSRLGRRGR